MKPGIHRMSAETYHQDPCDEPSLSASIARLLIDRSPRHAFHAHPRLNPERREESNGRMDFGSAAHSILLEGIDNVAEVVGFDDWRKKDAQEERDAARAEGKVPLLSKDLERMRAFCDAVGEQLGRFDLDPLPLRDGEPERSLIWREGDLWCRARIDWLHDSGEVIDDLKTTGTSASPHTWARTRLFADGRDIQCAFYRRGMRALTGADVDWRFVVCEVEPPYALSVISLAPSALELADRKVDRALELWQRCLAEDRWPGYPADVAYAEAPAWEMDRFLEAHWEEAPA